MKTRVLFSLKSMVITALFLMLTTSMAWAQGITYIDLNGEQQTLNDSYTSITQYNAPTILSDKWCVVDGEVNCGTTITTTPTGTDQNSFLVQLILKDNAILRVIPGSSNWAFNFLKHLVIYAQSTGDNQGILIADGQGINSTEGVSIYGGTIQATNISTPGFSISDGVVVVSGNLTSSGVVEINGGQVDITGAITCTDTDPDFYKIMIGLRNNTSDFIQAGSYTGSVIIADGQVLTDGTNYYSGTLNATQISAIAGKRLTRLPEYTITFNLNGGTMPDGVSMPSSYTAASNNITLPTPTNVGLPFYGWYDNENLLGEPVTTIPSGSTGNKEFWAKYGKDIANCTASVPDQFPNGNKIWYRFESANNGNAIIGETVIDGNDTLNLGIDYKFGMVSYYDGRDYWDTYSDVVGDICVVTIEGIGDYAGSIACTFTIVASASGTWNNGDLSWNIDTDGALSITLTNPEGGNKSMDKAANRESYPWHPYGSYITSITIGNGITSIADNAFAGTSNVNTYGGVTSVTLPSSLNSIGDYAFAYCSGATFNLDNIFANPQVTIDSIGTSAFNQVGKLVGTLSATADNTGLVSILVQTTNADVTFDGLTLYKDGTWNTLCLPFDLELTGTFLEGCTLMELDVDGYYNNDGNLWPGNINYDGYHQTSLADDGTLYLNFKVATSIEAGKPYLIKWASGESVVNPTFSGVNIASTTTSNLTSGDGKVIFKGTYKAVTSSIEEISLVENHNNATNAFHAFFTIKKMGNALTLSSNTLQNTNAMVYTTAWTANPTASATAWTSNGGWRFIASPIEANIAIAEVENLIDATPGNYDLYRLNPKTTTWENYKAVDANDNRLHADFTQMVNGKGYLYASASAVTLRYTGTPYNSSTKQVDLEQGYNLVGNPFATNATLDKSYYMLDEQGTTIMPNAVSGSTAIAPCTGVIVQSTVENEKVTFSKVTQQASAPNNGNLSIALTQTVATRSGNKVETLDKAIVSFNEGSELGKFYFGEQDANLYIPQNGEEYAIAYSEGQGEMPVNFKAKKNGEYTLTVSTSLNSKFQILNLIDNLTGANIDLLQTPSYTFTARNDDYPSRFKLVFSNENDNENEDFAFISNGEIIVNGEGTLQVIDMLGHQLISRQVSSDFRLPTSDFSEGMYVLRLINGQLVKTQKIVIK